MGVVLQTALFLSGLNLLGAEGRAGFSGVDIRRVSYMATIMSFGLA